jgi:hypothetical protein
MPVTELKMWTLLIHGFGSQCLPFENLSRVLRPPPKDGKQNPKSIHDICIVHF